MLLLILLCGVVSSSQAGEVRCIERERQALLNFKQGLIDRNDNLSSWGGQEHNCCTWKGVSCNENTSYVIGLQLPGYQLRGLMPESSFGQLTNLEIFDVSYNFLQGTVSESYFLSHHRLKVLDFSFNSLVFNSTTIDWVPPFQLDVLKLASCYLGPQFPKWLQTQSNVSQLDLSSTGISGQVPKWLWDLSPRLQYLNLSHNQFSVLQLSNNMFQGSLSSICSIDYGGGLLDLSYNRKYTAYLGTNLPSLQVLSLRHNEFLGTIPPEVCYLTGIQVLDLSGNNISGRIPRCFNNFTSLLPNSTTIDAFRAYPLHQYSSDVLSALVYWRGKEEEYNNTLGFLKLIDLSDNRFVGNIPKEISLLGGLISLNLSRNHLSGNIDSGIGQMVMLESLDLSRNQLSGSIPSGTQLQGFNASVYAGNNGLCGPPLAPCHAPDGPRTSQATDDDHVGKEDNKFDKGYYIS
ncbi:Receptor-like protein EIX2 [Sesamum angolense]|uniref:Receptor-like protein EIX2 n=1 Tax=Sesamum angolense TaxID=2727404 RepID=A0AAE2BMV1_9LAMI|nr:Receptor-like protein EIX2 [Sesamum angolense]